MKGGLLDGSAQRQEGMDLPRLPAAAGAPKLLDARLRAPPRTTLGRDSTTILGILRGTG
jgi:hypothetical protein